MNFALCANAGMTKCPPKCPSVPAAPAALQSLPGPPHSCSRARAGASCLTGDRGMPSGDSGGTAGTKAPQVGKASQRVPALCSNNLGDTIYKWEKMINLNKTLHVINSVSCFCSTCRELSCFIAVLYGAEVPFLGTRLQAGPGEGQGCGCPCSPVALAASQSIPRFGRAQARSLHTQAPAFSPRGRNISSWIHRWRRKPTPALRRDFNL